MIRLKKYIKYLVFFAVISSEIGVIHGKTLTKCCASDQALEIVPNSTKKYQCSKEFEKYVTPLSINNLDSIDIGFTGEVCVDKTVDGLKILELNSTEKEVKSVINLPTIVKCCPWGLVYNEPTKSCIVSRDASAEKGSIFDSNSSMYNLVFGVPICPPSDALVDYIFDDNYRINDGVITLENSTKFDNGTYCIDRSEQRGKIFIRTCEYKMDVCYNMTCVPKCCPSGQKYVKEPGQKSRCLEAYSLPFTPNFTNSDLEVIETPEKIALLSKIQCRQYIQREFTLFENGTLFFGSYLFEATDQNFCIGYLEGPLIQGYVALVCFPTLKPTGLHNFYYLAGLLVSIIFLGITITIYFFLPELQNLHGRTVMSHSTSLLASYIFLAMVKKPITSYSDSTCLILAYGIIYTFLVAFAWLNVMCFDIWYTFGVIKARGPKKQKNFKKFLLYSLYAYGMPLLIVIITLYVDRFSDVPNKFRPGFSSKSCWFNLKSVDDHLPYTIFFGTPVGVMILVNLIFFILTVRHCLKVRHDIQKMQHADSPKKRRFFTDKATLIMNLKLFIVMGITWMFEIISMYVREPQWLWYILDTINVFQGLWIFCIFVLKANVWKALRKKLGYQVVREGSQTQSTTFSTKNSLNSMHLTPNGTTTIRPEERDLLQTAIKNSANSMNGRR